MSSQRRRTGRTFKFDRYLTEARVDPFVLEVGDGEELSIPAPDGDTVLAIEESRSSRRTLELLCRDQRPSPGTGRLSTGWCADRARGRHGGPLRAHPGAAGGWAGLVTLIHRYGEAIEYDLHHELGIDLLDFFRAERPWPQLLRLVERSPDHSHYKVAIHDDGQLAQHQADHRGDTRPGRSRVDARTWTPERALLTDVADILLAIRASVDAARTGKR